MRKLNLKSLTMLSTFEKPISFFVVLQLLCSVIVTTNETNGVRFQEFHQDYNTNVRCGGAIRSLSGTITYKPSEPLLPNERCIWTVAAPGATTYMVYPVILGFPLEDHILSIAGLRHGEDNLTYYNIELGVEIPAVDVNLLIISLVTNGGNDTGTANLGFTLAYLSTGEGIAPDVNPNSTHEILGSDAFYLRHPPSGLYENNELSTFIYPPPNNIFNPHGKRSVIYKQLEIEANCTADHLSFFHLNSSLNVWNLVGIVCNETSVQLMASNEVAIIVFHSNSALVYSGFELISTTC